VVASVARAVAFSQPGSAVAAAPAVPTAPAPLPDSAGASACLVDFGTTNQPSASVTNAAQARPEAHHGDSQAPAI